MEVDIQAFIIHQQYEERLKWIFPPSYLKIMITMSNIHHVLTPEDSSVPQ